MDTCLVYITASGRDEALAIGRALIADRLAACANVLGPVTSIFRWEGAVQEEDEVALIVKTRRALVDDLAARVKTLHSYSCPCVVALPIAAGNPDFLDWIAAETGSAVGGTA